MTDLSQLSFITGLKVLDLNKSRLKSLDSLPILEELIDLDVSMNLFEVVADIERIRLLNSLQYFNFSYSSLFESPGAETAALSLAPWLLVLNKRKLEKKSAIFITQ